MKWRNIKKLKDVNSIKEVEDKLKLIFPNDFKKVIINNNNGVPSDETFDTTDLKGKSFGKLLDFNLDNSKNILFYCSLMEKKLPTNVIPITITGGGDHLCYDYREDKNNPKIYYWDHEQISEIDGDELIIPDHEYEYEYYRLNFVADSFDALLQMLYNDDDPDKYITKFIWEDIIPEDQLHELSDENLAEVNARRIKQGLPPIVK